MRRKIIIAGGGIAGLNAAKAAREKDPDCNVIMLEEGDSNTYVRTRLPDYISGEASYKELFPYSDSWYEANKISFHKNTRITGVDTVQKTVATSMGPLDFDALVIALGSSGNVPPIPGATLDNCFTVRTVHDADKIRGLSGKDKTCTIIGGGLLGLEMAWAIRQLGCSINIIETAPRLLPKQSDEHCSELLLKAISEKGMKLFLNAQIREVGGNGRVEYVRLKDGVDIPSDFVILSTGVKANIQPFAASGINIGRSITVDEHMKTSADGIYAAGDVAEYNGRNFSIWPIAIAQGKVAGCNAAGGSIVYDEINPFTSLKIKGITMFSIGDILSEDSEVIAELDKKTGRYVKLLIKEDAITGAIVFGDSTLPLKVKKAVEQRSKLPSDRSRLGVKELIERL